MAGAHLSAVPSLARPFFNDAVAGAAVAVKAAAGTIYLARLVNTTAAAAYLQVFGIPAASVVLGTTVPDYCIRLLASEGITLPLPFGVGIASATGLSIAGCSTPTGSTGAAISVMLAVV